MEEPSVLDYLKAKLLPWRGPAPEIPALPESDSGTRRVAVKTVKAAPEVEAPEMVIGWANLPWKTPLVFALLIFAQVLWQTRGGSWQFAAFLAALALGMGIWAAQRGEWRLPAANSEEASESRLLVQYWPLILTLVFFAIAFSSSGGNLFTVLNVLAWLAAVLLAFAAFRQPERDPESYWERLKNNFRVQDGFSRPSNWQLILLASFVLIGFFRFYRLADVPLEMVSDHAEKLLDVQDILKGQTPIFFPRNTGREPLQFYLTAAIASWLGTGLSFISLKIGTALMGFFSLIYVYLLGKDLGGRWVGLLAMLLMGVAYWPNVLARTGLRFILYPAFVAPALYYLLRGLRLGRMQSYLLSGLFLGLGLYGYTAFRVVPLIFLVALAIFLLHKQAGGRRGGAIASFAILTLIALLVFTPLLRYTFEEDSFFNYRVLTRVSSLETGLPGPALQIFLSNVWNALAMTVKSAGNIWLVGLIRRPALDLFSGALFLLGVPLLALRYLRQRDWQDLFWLISIPLLMLPSILSLAFPEENPAMNRAGAAAIPIFLIAAFALDAFLHGIKDHLGSKRGLRAAWLLGAIVLILIAGRNYDLVFRQYAGEYALYSWNSSELGEEIREFADSGARGENAWVIAYPHWVDTRLVGINAGFPIRDFGISPDQLESTLLTPAPKLFLLHMQDTGALQSLQSLYPDGESSLLLSSVPGKEFVSYFVANDAQ